MPQYDYQVTECADNGEFLTYAKLLLLIDMKVVETHEFHGSSEFPGEDATAQAVSFASAWYETMTTTLEERLAPFGIEWEREQYERADCPF